MKINANSDIKLEMNNGTMKIYVNNVLKSTNNNISQNNLHYFRTYSNRSLTVKDLKIHEL